MVKTNALRQLDTAGIKYETVEYEVDESDLSGLHIASVNNLDREKVFKTLVTHGDGGVFVFCIPVAEELDLKKCAAASGQKKIDMIHVKELMGLTGYMRGGCSPVGMKKKYPVFIDETAQLFDKIYVSAGQRGLQMYLSVKDLAAFINASFADLTRI